MWQLLLRFWRNIFHLVIFGNGYIALCAVVMCLATTRLFRLQVPDSLFILLFTGTLASYSLHWYLTDSSADQTHRGRWNHQHKRLLILSFAGASIVCLIVLVQLRAHILVLLPVILLTFLYTAPKIDWPPFYVLRRIAILKTAYLALVWAYATSVLPFFFSLVPHSFDWAIMVNWFLNRFFLIYSIALWFDYRDRVDDKQSKWLTIVSMLNEKQIRTFEIGIASCFFLTLIALHNHGFTALISLCLALPMIVLLLTARLISRQSSDYWYYVYLDGLLLFSGLLLIGILA
jgi:hypothetical protein